MKFKKIFLALLLMFGLALAGCSKQAANKPAPVLTKSQVLKKSQKPFKSGQVIQSVRLATDTANQTVIANTIFGGDKSTIFHITNQTTAKGKTRSSEEWINMNNVFLHGDNWYKAELDQLSGHSYAELMAAIVNNPVISDPDSSLIKAYKMSRKGQTYTLNAKVTDKNVMADAAEQIAGTVGQTADQEAVFRRILKYGKFQDMTVKLVVKEQKLYSCNIFINLKLGKQMTAHFGQSYGNFGSHDFLKVPETALDAKPLPTTSTKKK